MTLYLVINGSKVFTVNQLITRKSLNLKQFIGALQSFIGLIIGFISYAVDRKNKERKLHLKS